MSSENSVEPESVPGQPEEAPPAEDSAAGLPAGRRNPPGGKSSLILGWTAASSSPLHPVISEPYFSLSPSHLCVPQE